MTNKRKVTSKDPADIIAEALRKKICNRVQHSPDPSDTESESPDFDSPERDSPVAKVSVTF